MIKVSPNQYRIIEFLSKGLSNQEIAQELGYSRRTVENHIYDISLRATVTSSNRTRIVFLYFEGEFVIGFRSKKYTLKRKILSLLHEGLSAKEICRELDCSIQTVHRHQKTKSASQGNSEK